MNELTIHGNLTANPVEHCNPRTGATAVVFDVAVNSRRYDRDSGEWIDRAPVYYRVVCFRHLAANCAASLSRGTTVTVTGQIVDDSYTPAEGGRPVRRTRLEAADVAVSLRWVAVSIRRDEKPDQAPAVEAQLASDTDSALGFDTATETADAVAAA